MRRKEFHIDGENNQAELEAFLGEMSFGFLGTVSQRWKTGYYAA